MPDNFDFCLYSGKVEGHRLSCGARLKIETYMVGHVLPFVGELI
jgi:hypothetical protein